MAMAVMTTGSESDRRPTGTGTAGKVATATRATVRMGAGIVAMA
jgi:proline racemase